MRTVIAASLVVLSGLSACSSSEADGDPEDGIAVDDGKEDNFLAVDAIEYCSRARRR
jgi:hypothetical protein